MELMKFFVPRNSKCTILVVVLTSLLLSNSVGKTQTGLRQVSNPGELNESYLEDSASDQVIELLVETNFRVNRRNVHAALETANEALALATKIGDEYLQFAARGHVDSVNTLIYGIGDKVNREDYSKLKNASTELRLLYFSNQLLSRVWYLSEYTDFKQLLEEYAIAAAESGDPKWLLKQRTDDVFVRVFCLDENLRSPQLLGKYQELKGLSEEHAYEPGLAVCSFAEGASQKSSHVDAQIALFQVALEHAKKSGNNLLIFKGYTCLAASYYSKNDTDSYKHFQWKALNNIESLGASALAIQFLPKLAIADSKDGRPFNALENLDRVFNSPGFLDLPEKRKRSLEGMREIFSELAFESDWFTPDGLDHAEKIKNLEELESYDRSAVNNHQFRDISSQFVKIKLESQADKKATEAANNKVKTSNKIIQLQNERIQFFKNLAIGLGALVIFLVPWSAMYFLKARLKKVSQELDSERAVARESQDQCDELSHRINRLQRMESLGLMAGSVAHDFNNILVGVMGNAEVIQLKNECKTDLAADDEFVRERIRNIITSAEKAASLSRQMLAYAGKQYIARTTTDLNELIRQYETILHSSCRKNQKLKFELDPGQVVSKVDVTQIEQVVLNLVTNAAEASDDEGTITVRTGSLEITQVENDRFLFGARTTGGSFNFIDVIDSGSGISEKHIDRIFEPFFTNSELGRGLGLSVVYGAVTGHDGFVQCKSEIGVGASFRIMIPCSTEAIISNESAESFPRAEFLEESDADTMQKILVIDDEETVLELCSELMQLNGWEVIKAVGGDEGLRLAKQHASELTCILADVVMPEMGANELLRELELREINVPVVLMSGFSQTRLEFFLEKENVVSIVQKPFRASEIKRAVLTASRFKKTPEMVSIAKVPNPDYPK